VFSAPHTQETKETGGGRMHDSDVNDERDSPRVSDEEYDAWEAQFTGCQRGN
jgi:hypothetical protein